MTLPAARIIFAGGGTGGHLYPAIAIANRIREMLHGVAEVEIAFVGTKRGIEYRLRETLGYPLYLINMRGIARSLSLKNLLVPFVIVGALVKARLLLRRFDPQIVVGTGGYVAWPVLRAAAAAGITTVLQEQNSYPGIVTRQAASRASMVYLGFEKARDYLHPRVKTMVTGNPVRTDLRGADRAEALRQFGLDPELKTILVLGGSQGARSINSAVLRSVEAGILHKDIQLVWQTGKRDYKDVTSQVGNKASGCALFPYAEDMRTVYAAADLAVARAGALTLAELEACGIPSILIPYPHAAGDHQRKNAAVTVEQGRAVMFDEQDLVGRDLLGEAIALLHSKKYAAMRAALASGETGQPAVDKIAEHIISLMGIERKDGLTA